MSVTEATVCHQAEENSQGCLLIAWLPHHGREGGVEPAKVWGVSFLGAAEWLPSVPRVTSRCLSPFLLLVGSGRDFCVPGTRDESPPQPYKQPHERAIVTTNLQIDRKEWI